MKNKPFGKVSKQEIKSRNLLKKSGLFLGVFVLSIFLVAAFMVDDLKFINLKGNQASGHVSILSVRSVHDNVDNVRISLDVNKLDNNENRVFEAWVVDVDSGYKLSLGSFSTNTNGRESFLFTQKIVNFKVYDAIVITSENIDDINPYPSSDVVLFAEIPGSNRQLVRLEANLSTSQQASSINSSTSGFGEFIMNTTQNTISYDIYYADLKGNETMAHIHGFADKGVNAGVLFNLSLGDSKSGIWNYSQGDEDKILQGLTYVNVHSDLYPAGEIRGQIIKVNDDLLGLFNMSTSDSGGVHISGNLSGGIV